jgi:hypothetical protein
VLCGTASQRRLPFRDVLVLETLLDLETLLALEYLLEPILDAAYKVELLRGVMSCGAMLVAALTGQFSLLAFTPLCSPLNWSSFSTLADVSGTEPLEAVSCSLDSSAH